MYGRDDIEEGGCRRERMYYMVYERVKRMKGDV